MGDSPTKPALWVYNPTTRSPLGHGPTDLAIYEPENCGSQPVIPRARGPSPMGSLFSRSLPQILSTRGSRTQIHRLSLAQRDISHSPQGFLQRHQGTHHRVSAPLSLTYPEGLAHTVHFTPHVTHTRSQSSRSSPGSPMAPGGKIQMN